jgi:hypothetical protein
MDGAALVIERLEYEAAGSDVEILFRTMDQNI